MKLRKLLLSGLMMAGAITASAQAPEAKTVYDFNPHWYVQLQGGVQYTLGEIKFKDLWGPNVQGAIGYQFNPNFGMRLSVNGWSSRAGSDFGNDLSGENYYQWKWYYVAPAIDFRVSLSNLLFGYNPKRVVDIGAFIGGGVNIAWANDKNKGGHALYELNRMQSALNTVGNLDAYRVSDKANLMEYYWSGTKVRAVGRAGITADFNITDRFALGLEVNANMLCDHYNSKKAGNPDWYFNALAGLKFNLGSTYTERTITPPAPQVVEKVIEKVVEKPAPAPAPVAEKEGPMRRDVFFTINKSLISKSEASKVREIADYLNAHPNASVEVTGYADAGTGNKTINDRLAKRRAAAVVNSLVNDYGIASSRIKSDSKGDRVQPFAENDKNRVAICIVE